MPDLLIETERFRAWAAAYPGAGQTGEWECDYADWSALSEAVLVFAQGRSFASWSETELQAVLYAIARDNEMQYLARQLRQRHPQLILQLARAALQVGERDDRWQLAVELGELGPQPESESLLLELARDEHEYVRRRALRALLSIGSAAVEEIALAAWHRPDEEQEWARMMALYCLHQIGSARLEELLLEAEQDERPYLRGYAKRVRSGQGLD